jgi:hypothetical protein
MAIAHVATGTALFGVNTFSPVVGSEAATHMMILLVGGKPYNASITVPTSGWTEIGSGFTDGTTAAGVDTGSMVVRAYYKEATSGAETDPAVTEGGTAFNVVGGLVMVFSKDGSEVWDTPVAVGGGDASAGTGFSVTGGSNPGITAGDHCISFAAFRSDAATPCSSHLTPTATGATFTNTHDPATDPETTSGGDMGMCATRSTLTGTASAAPVMAATLAASHTGSAMFIRLRVSTPVPNPAPRRQRTAHRFLTMR